MNSIIEQNYLSNAEEASNGMTVVTALISTNQTIEIKDKPEYERASKPNYFMIGNGTMNKSKIQSIDLLEEFSKLSKAGQFLLLRIKNEICYSNNYHYIANIPQFDMTATEKQYMKLGYKELRALDLVRRTSRSHYMINPSALIPNDYERAVSDWDAAALLS